MISLRPALLALVSLFLIACGGTASPTSIILTPTHTSTPIPLAESSQEISVSFLNPEIIIVKHSSINQNNCGGNSILTNTVSRTRSIEHVMTTDIGLAVSATGTVSVLGTGIELGTQVSTSLGYSYGATAQFSRSMTVSAQPQTFVTHDFVLQEIWDVGVSNVKVGTDELAIPFRIRSDFAIELVESSVKPCPTPSPTPTATFTPTPTPTFTVTPEIAETPTPTSEVTVVPPTRTPTSIPSITISDIEPTLQLVNIDLYRDENNKEWADYNLRVTNWGSLPTEMFEFMAPTPECTNFSNSTRVMVFVYDAISEEQITFFCALSSPQSLNNMILTLQLVEGQPLFQKIYIDILDRQQRVIYRSNSVELE